MISSLDAFLKHFTDWAGSRADVLAVALVGSQARGTARPDSDVDLVVLTRDPQRYLRDTAWVNSFGDGEKMRQEDYGRVQSLRVWYRDGLEVEYSFTDEHWADLPLDEDTYCVIANGMRMLFERGALLSRCLIEIKK